MSLPYGLSAISTAGATFSHRLGFVTPRASDDALFIIQNDAAGSDPVFKFFDNKHVTYAPIVPDANATRALGGASLRWSTVYGAAGDYSGTVTANLFSGSGASLTALVATNLASGTVPDARFPATLPAASGVNLTALNATNIASGLLAHARIADLDALSVFGRSANSSGVMAAIAAGTDGHILRRSGTSIGFGTLAFAALPTGSGSWDVGSGETITLTRGVVFGLTATFSKGQQIRWGDANQSTWVADTPAHAPIDNNVFTFQTGGSFIWRTPSTNLMCLNAGGILGLGTIAPNVSAQIEMVSTAKGFLPPRMTTAQKNAITGVTGLVLYDTDLAKLQVYSGGAWVSLH